jgi:hypothetical protein
MILESIVIDREVEKVYDTFLNLDSWTRILPDVLAVEVLYDSGCHQEFLMTVERPGGPETIRGIRFCQLHESIELFQPVPPPGFRKMAGVWSFKSSGQGTYITVSRSFALKDSDADTNKIEQVYQATSQKLSAYLRKNLGLFKASLEERK